MTIYSSPSTQKSSVVIEDVDKDGEDSISPSAHPASPEQIVAPIDGSDGGTEDNPPTDEEEEEEEEEEGEESEMSKLVSVNDCYY
jgi:hypothetical protein